ncbi:MAG: hypothetical protein JKX69_09725 [Rhodobacteraceae bacterium]|nr:hypothetical protein [Paracoccaceae bacterium]
MNKHLIAAAAATALTFASIGAPAQADIDRDNVARAIFGVAAVAIIAGAISSGSNQPTVVYTLRRHPNRTIRRSSQRGP